MHHQFNLVAQVSNLLKYRFIAQVPSYKQVTAAAPLSLDIATHLRKNLLSLIEA
jgi:hypothetical protein